MSSVGVFAFAAASAVDQPVAAEEDEATDEEPADHRAVPGRRVGRFLDEVERHCADQHAATERHDQADDPPVDLEIQGEQRADHQRGRGQEPPTECAGHDSLPLI